MFSPKYEITHALLENIKRIYSLTQALNQRRFPHTVFKYSPIRTGRQIAGQFCIDLL